MVITDAHPRIEVILQDFALNSPENYGKEVLEGKILHLINLTGFSGNTYFDPLPIHDISFKIKTDFEPKKIWGMSSEKELDFTYDKGYVSLKLDRLDDFEGVVIEK